MEILRKCEYDMEKEIEIKLGTFVYAYVCFCRKYAEIVGGDSTNYQRYIDLRSLRISIFLEMPIELINQGKEAFINTIEKYLWYQFITEEVVSDGAPEKVRIEGYTVSEKQVSSFILLDLLLYNHVINKFDEKDKESFFMTMILCPCLHKMINLDEDVKELVFKYFDIKPVELQKLGEYTERIDLFEHWIKLFNYEYFCDIRCILDKRSEIEEVLKNILLFYRCGEKK